MRAQPAHPKPPGSPRPSAVSHFQVAGSPPFCCRVHMGTPRRPEDTGTRDRSANDTQMLSSADLHRRFLRTGDTWDPSASPLSSSIYLFHNLHSTPNSVSAQCQEPWGVHMAVLPTRWAGERLGTAESPLISERMMSFRWRNQGRLPGGGSICPGPCRRSVLAVREGHLFKG